MPGEGGGNVVGEGCDKGCQWSGHVARRGDEQSSRGSTPHRGATPKGVVGMIEVTASEVAPAITLLEVGDAPGVKPGG